MTEGQRSAIGLLVNDKPGVLSRITGIFARRAYNIESLVVARSLDEKRSHMTITCQGPEDVLDQIIKQLNKLVDVIWARDYSRDHEIEDNGGKPVIREYALIRVRADVSNRSDIEFLVRTFRGQIINVSTRGRLTVGVAGATRKVDQLVELLSQTYEVVDVTRTGKIVLPEDREA